MLCLVNQGSQVRSPASPEPISIESAGAPVIFTQTINPPGPLLVKAQEKPQKHSFQARKYSSLVLMSDWNLIINWVEHEISFVTSRLGFGLKHHLFPLLLFTSNWSSGASCANTQACLTLIWLSMRLMWVYLSRDMRFQQCGMCDQ